jgi:hypothetical protein
VAVAVTVKTPVVGLPTFAAVNVGIEVPLPDAPRPIPVLLFVQFTLAAGFTLKETPLIADPAHTDNELIPLIDVIVGVGLTVIVKVPCDEARFRQPEEDEPVTVYIVGVVVSVGVATTVPPVVELRPTAGDQE